MNIISVKSALLLIMAINPFNLRADYPEELRALSRIDLLPRYLDHSLVGQVSSYDTTGGNDDGFSGKYSFLRKENGSLVIADLKGPGIIQRIWTPTPTMDTIQFFFDNEPEPRISLRFIDLFNGQHYPFVRPVVGNEVGGYYCYLPIPYRSSCKIILKGPRMQFFQIQYRELTGGRLISSYPPVFSQEEEEALDTAVKVWSTRGREVIGMMNIEGIKSRSSTIVLKPGETAGIFTQRRGGRIVGLEIVPQGNLSGNYKDILFQARWDDDPSPAINCPVTDFFGYAFGKPSMQSMLAGVDNGVHYCFFPMPFDRKASLGLKYLDIPGNSRGNITCSITIYYTDIARQADEGRFYASWQREINPAPGEPYTILSHKGRGHFAGTILQAQGLNPGMTLFFEGDDICTIDGEMRLHGTGSEDFFNGGWYALPDRWDQAFSLPVHGCLAYSIPLARTGGYRIFLADKLAFERSIDLTIEHGPEGNSVPVDYTSVAFYYSDAPAAGTADPEPPLLAGIKPPTFMEYWIQLLPVQALSNGAVLSRENIRDTQNGRDFNVLKLTAGKGGYAKFELEVPDEGIYKLYLTYFQGPECSSFAVNQRQVPVGNTIDAHAPEWKIIEKEFIGTLNVRDGTNTITVVLKDHPGGAGRGSFSMQGIFLEK